MKIREKIETISLFELLDGSTLSNVIDTLEAKKMKAYKDGYLNLELEIEFSNCYSCSGIEALDLYGSREETKKEKENRLAKKKRDKEQKEKNKKTQEEKDKALILTLAKKYNLTIKW